MTDKIRIIQIGLGPIGLEVARIVSHRPRAQIVAAVDIDPNKKGLKLSVLAKVSGPSMHAVVSDNLESTLKQFPADVIIVTTSSYIKTLHAQLTEILPHGIPVLTTCEELSYPWQTNVDLARQIDALAKKHKTAVLSTGVNPGFLMDFFPAVASGLCEHISSIRVERIQDASKRRLPFQKKIGAGLTPEEYQCQVEAGTLRHMGLKESVYLLAARMNWTLDEVTETIAPVMDKTNVIGTRQVATATHNNYTVIELVFHAQMHETNPRDAVTIHGTPEFTLAFTPPIQGDIATAAIVVNAIPSIINATPGLKTMADMAGVSYWV